MEMKRRPTSGASAASFRVPSRSFFGETPSARSKSAEDSSRSLPFGTATVMISSDIKTPFALSVAPAERARSRSSGLLPPDARAERRELLLDPLVAAVEVVDALDLGRPARGEPGEYERRRCAQVGRHHRRARERRHALHDRDLPVHRDVRAEPLQLLHVHEPILEHGLRDLRRALGEAEEHHQLGLPVGREALVRRGLHVHWAGPAVAYHAHPAADLCDLRADSAQLLDERREVLGHAALDGDVAAGERPRDEERPRLDPVRDDRVIERTQRRDALDAELVRARALDPRAHPDERGGEVRHLRLAGAVSQDRAALRERRRHHHVLGAGHRLAVEGEDRAVQAAARRRRLDVAVLEPDLGPEGGEPLQVLVDRPRADGAAARERDARPSPAGDERPEHEDGRAHRLHELVGRLRPDRGGDAERHLARRGAALDRTAHVTEQLPERPHVREIGDVADRVIALREQRGGDHGQRGVLRARDVHAPAERHASFDDDLVHFLSGPCSGRAARRASAGTPTRARAKTRGFYAGSVPPATVATTRRGRPARSGRASARAKPAPRQSAGSASTCDSCISRQSVPPGFTREAAPRTIPRSTARPSSPPSRAMQGSRRTSRERPASSPVGTYGGFETTTSKSSPAWTAAHRSPVANSTTAPSATAFSRASASASSETSVARTRAPFRASASETATHPEPVQRSRALPPSGSAASAASTRSSVSGRGTSTRGSTRNG